MQPAAKEIRASPSGCHRTEAPQSRQKPRKALGEDRNHANPRSSVSRKRSWGTEAAAQ